MVLAMMLKIDLIMRMESVDMKEGAVAR